MAGEYTGPARSYVPPAPLTPGTYYWHVQVDTGAGYGDWMPTWTVVITAAKPGQVVLSAPATNTHHQRQHTDVELESR